MLGGGVLKRRRLVRLARKSRAYRDCPTNSLLGKASVVTQGAFPPLKRLARDLRVGHRCQ
jgi:hypothetical protein